MLRGLATVSFFADDVTAAMNWYTTLLGTEPYFVRPAGGPPVYAEFRVGDDQDELGIWSHPDGKKKLAWFKDPDGNVLGLTQY